MFAPTRKSTSLLKVSFIDLTYFRISMIGFAPASFCKAFLATGLKIFRFAARDAKLIKGKGCIS